MGNTSTPTPLILILSTALFVCAQVNFAGPAAVGDFMFRAATGDVGTIQAIYGIPPGEVPLMVDYLLHIQGTYGLFGLQAMTTLDAGAGLFADKTPHEWLFEYIDPLVMRTSAAYGCLRC